jgi:tetratricopeptide (TPR) repeat protein
MVRSLRGTIWPLPPQIAPMERCCSTHMSQFSAPAPPSLEDALSRLRTAVGREDYENASEIAAAALSAGHVHPALFNARALWLERAGRDEEALGCYARARALTPKDSGLLNAMGLCLTRMGEFQDAIEVFDQALLIAPAYAPSHHRKAMALGHAGHWDLAERSHLRAVQLHPRYAEALASLAVIAAKRGDAGKARANAERALGFEPDNATAQVALALLEIETRNFADAETRLRRALAQASLSDQGRATALGILADALDGLDKTADAFAAYAAANELRLKLQGDTFTLQTRASVEIARLISDVSDLGRDAWMAVSEGTDRTDAPSRHVFILGFPRSGTTLLGRALAARDDTIVLEEKDFLEAPARRYLSDRAGLEALAELQGPALSLARDIYWQNVQASGGDFRGKVLVDKHPFNSLKLPLIAKLFPQARIVLALRDPRDVVFSCFRRHLGIDYVRRELLTIEGAAQLYDATMRLVQTCRQQLPINLHEHRYENLVTDFDVAMRAVCSFLEISWQESMRRFTEAAGDLGAGHASANQVRRDLYAEGVGRWRHYASEMKPALPFVDPWAVQLGYE